jgi:hypothetical protein
MKKRKHVSAIFVYNENVSQFLTDALAFIIALSTAPGNTVVTIAATAITAARNHITTAQNAETNVASHTIGTADARDVAVNQVVTDVQNFVAIVQTAANNATDVATATTIVTECGLVTRKPASKSKPSFAAKNDSKVSGLFDFIYKAAGKGVHACFETQESIDNINWVTIKTSPDSRYSFAHGKPVGTKVWLRGRMILSEKKGGAQAWMTPSTPFLYTN